MSATGNFEDILDGYFPLRFSIADIMRRNNLRHAVLEMSFAPIIEVGGLAAHAPIPLNIRSGRAGMIDTATLFVSVKDQETWITGEARWRWLDGTPVAAVLDPMTRLAEPALISLQTATEPLGSGANLIRTR